MVKVNKLPLPIRIFQFLTFVAYFVSLYNSSQSPFVSPNATGGLYIISFIFNVVSDAQLFNVIVSYAVLPNLSINFATITSALPVIVTDPDQLAL